MILSGAKILEEVRAGRIEIDPFDDSHVNPASVDLCLGEIVRRVLPPRQILPTAMPFHDVKRPGEIDEWRIGDVGQILTPGILYLMHTKERIHTDCYVPVLDGKSSIGRLGIVVHLTAGYGDPGFRGQYTLEVTTIHAIRIYAGMRICQMRFHTLLGATDRRQLGQDGDWVGLAPEQSVDYQKVGHYTGEQLGPQPSRAYKQFEKK